MPIWRTENKYEAVIPTTRVPVTGDPGTDLLITGHQVLRFSPLNRFERKDTIRQGSADLYSRKQPYDLRITPTGPGMLPTETGLVGTVTSRNSVDSSVPRIAYSRPEGET